MGKLASLANQSIKQTKRANTLSTNLN